MSTSVAEKYYRKIKKKKNNVGNQVVGAVTGGCNAFLKFYLFLALDLILILRFNFDAKINPMKLHLSVDLDLTYVTFLTCF